jgi:hypothetical protein
MHHDIRTAEKHEQMTKIWAALLMQHHPAWAILGRSRRSCMAMHHPHTTTPLHESTETDKTATQQHIHNGAVEGRHARAAYIVLILKLLPRQGASYTALVLPGNVLRLHVFNMASANPAAGAQPAIQWHLHIRQSTLAQTSPPADC